MKALTLEREAMLVALQADLQREVDYLDLCIAGGLVQNIHATAESIEEIAKAIQAEIA